MEKLLGYRKFVNRAIKFKIILRSNDAKSCQDFLNLLFVKRNGNVERV